MVSFLGVEKVRNSAVCVVLFISSLLHATCHAKLEMAAKVATEYIEVSVFLCCY